MEECLIFAEHEQKLIHEGIDWMYSSKSWNNFLEVVIIAVLGSMWKELGLSCLIG